MLVQVNQLSESIKVDPVCIIQRYEVVYEGKVVDSFLCNSPYQALVIADFAPTTTPGKKDGLTSYWEATKLSKYTFVDNCHNENDCVLGINELFKAITDSSNNNYYDTNHWFQRYAAIFTKWCKLKTPNSPNPITLLNNEK